MKGVPFGYRIVPQGLLFEVQTTMRHARTFITSREKMHETGVQIWDGLAEQIDAALQLNAAPTRSDDK